MDECLARLAELANRARPALQKIATQPLSERVERFNRHMFDDEGFRGCEQDDYYKPRQSFLNEVLENRTGIPITLSIVYVDVARRLGLNASGIGFPGHFLTKVEPGPGADAHDSCAPIIVDPFLARTIDEDECVARLRRALGPQARFDPGRLRAASGRETLVRVLQNLKQNYLTMQDWEAALRCADRILLVTPDSPLELRDRGILYRELECFGAATYDLERFLELAPQHESAGVIRKSLAALRGHTSTLH